MILLKQKPLTLFQVNGLEIHILGKFMINILILALSKPSYQMYSVHPMHILHICYARLFLFRTQFCLSFRHCWLFVFQALLTVLRESHRSRTVFRKVNGFVYVMSLLLSMEGCLLDPPKAPWDSGKCVMHYTTSDLGGNKLLIGDLIAIAHVFRKRRLTCIIVNLRIAVHLFEELNFCFHLS